MQTYLKTKPVWVQLMLFLGIAFGLFLIISMIGAFVLSQITGISVLELQDVNSWDSSNPNMIIYIRGLLLVQFISLFLIPSLLFSYYSDPKPMEYLGIKKPTHNMYWILAVMALIVAIPFVDLMGMVNQKLPFGAAQEWMKTMEEDAAKQIQFMLNKHTVGELFMNIFFIAVLAGVGEELFFRGILQRMFIKMTKNPWQGIVITAALFSAFHFQFFGFIPRLLLGIVLGAIYWYSGSLLTAILAHFAYDAFMIILIYLNPQMLENIDATIMQQSTTQLIITGILSLGVTVFVIWLMKKKSVASYEKVYREDHEVLDDLKL